MITGMSVSRMTTVTTAFTSGNCWPSRIAPKIHNGRVFCAPAVNTVTMTSSNDRANASSAPDTSAVAVSGNVTNRSVCGPRAPRSMDASAKDPGVRRSLAITLLNTTTMQNVACPMTIVRVPSRIPVKEKKEFSAMPVMMPGRASGSTNKNEIASRPKNLNWRSA